MQHKPYVQSHELYAPCFCFFSYILANITVRLFVCHHGAEVPLNCMSTINEDINWKCCMQQQYLGRRCSLLQTVLRWRSVGEWAHRVVSATVIIGNFVCYKIANDMKHAKNRLARQTRTGRRTDGTASLIFPSKSASRAGICVYAYTFTTICICAAESPAPGFPSYYVFDSNRNECIFGISSVCSLLLAR